MALKELKIHIDTFWSYSALQLIINILANKHKNQIVKSSEENT